MNKQRLAASPDTSRGHAPDAMARGLGWFSIGLGLAELFMTDRVARASGMQGREGMLRLYGVREVVQGMGILMARDRTPWVWGRVAGDAVDIATLASGLNSRNPRVGNTVAALVAVGGVTAMDVATAKALKTNRHRVRPYYDYSARSGFPKGLQQARGIAAGKVKEKRGPHRLTDTGQRPEKQGQTPISARAERVR